MARDLMPNNKCLVMFSGGKDSFITACKMVEEGFDVELLSFNNGAVVGEENLLHGVRRLQNRYGEDTIKYVGIYCTASSISRLTDYWAYTPALEVGNHYPNILNAQLTCLHCQTAMWVAAVAYAATREDIKFIATGYRCTDLFCTGQQAWIDCVSNVARANGLSVKFPVWDNADWDEYDGWARDKEMIERAFEPQVLEPKCLLGRPVKPMTEMEKSDTFRYFKDVLLKEMDTGVARLKDVLRTIKLSEQSLIALHYDPPTGEHGLY